MRSSSVAAEVAKALEELEAAAAERRFGARCRRGEETRVDHAVEDANARVAAARSKAALARKKLRKPLRALRRKSIWLNRSSRVTAPYRDGDLQGGGGVRACQRSVRERRRSSCCSRGRAAAEQNARDARVDAADEVCAAHDELEDAVDRVKVHEGRERPRGKSEADALGAEAKAWEEEGALQSSPKPVPALRAARSSSDEADGESEIAPRECAEELQEYARKDRCHVASN